IASAVASVATRRPRRPSSAWRTASLTSAVSRGSGVSLSNGRIATVLTLGSVPPANLYGHPASPRLDALMRTAPNSRRNDGRGINHTNRELKSRRPLRKVDARTRGPLCRVELGAAPRYDFAPPPPFGLQHRLATRAVGHDIVERILGLSKPPHDAALVRQRIHDLRAQSIGIAGISDRKFFSGSAHSTESPITTAAPLPQLNGPA